MLVWAGYTLYVSWLLPHSHHSLLYSQSALLQIRSAAWVEKKFPDFLLNRSLFLFQFHFLKLGNISLPLFRADSTQKKTEPCTEETFPFPRQAFIFIQLYELIIMCFHVWLQQSCIELKWPASSASKTKRKCQKSVLIFKRNIKHIPTQTMDFHKMLNGIFFMNRGLFASFQLWKRKFPPSEMVPLKPILIQFGPIEMHWINFRIIVSSRSDSLVIFCMVIFKYHVRI